ncbi:class I SAM-dependent methyltransferase [Nonomuraea sp. SYSU D8015]|uniref:class I SAM-dependent methyltransferase n=1 Tax=Nonomuraea sp. SYSU D8015 TaxID=2593644 RepID=UPI001660F761|nr:class I SAM-dependent methyltransferase [Nonomuraea sp. SYSU D8015]
MSEHVFGLFHNPRLYDRMNRNHGFRRLYERAVNDVATSDLPAGARVLDVGTGPGRVPIALSRRRPDLDIEGLDLSRQMIAYAREAAGQDSTVRFTVGDVAALPHPDAGIDLVITTMSQHHWRDPEAGMRELSRVLREDGRLWVYDFRFFLGRAERAARAAFTRHTFHRARVSPLAGRLTVAPA